MPMVEAVTWKEEMEGEEGELSELESKVEEPKKSGKRKDSGRPVFRCAVPGAR